MLRETEDELVQAAQTGNIAAFERLLRLQEARMLAVAAGFASTPDDANDIYQDAMLTAYRALPGFRGECKFSTWLYRIVVTTALSNRRQLQRQWRKLMAYRDETTQGEQYGTADPLESNLIDEEFNQEINRALRRLSDSERMAFVLCHQQDFKLKEAAEVMSCTENSIKVFLFRARNKLKVLLQHHYSTGYRHE
ncbi:MAG: RNA polymerase sigma factor [Pseudomonadales bacterium]|nr:RNA polymerase sigma factor [Pseudomonadales bacterium]